MKTFQASKKNFRVSRSLNVKYFQLLPSRRPPFPDAESRLNVFLYIGLGMMAIGLVFTVVGVGETGFKTMEMKMVGPSLMVGGLVLTILRLEATT